MEDTFLNVFTQPVEVTPGIMTRGEEDDRSDTKPPASSGGFHYDDDWSEDMYRMSSVFSELNYSPRSGLWYAITKSLGVDSLDTLMGIGERDLECAMEDSKATPLSLMHQRSIRQVIAWLGSMEGRN
jgi:hypothetical protein